MKISIPVTCLIAVFLMVGRVMAGPATAPATTQPQQINRFMRFVNDEKSGGKKGGTLQTADVLLRNRDGATVRLVAAVHIADGSYYKELNHSFEDCDAVLYEMVKPKDAAAPLPGESNSDISKLQRFLKDTLDLSFQLDGIDYEKPNFVHADLDAETFSRMQEERGESLAGLILAGILKSLTHPEAMQSYPDEPSDGLDLMTRPDGTRQFKLILARRMGDIEKGAMGLDDLNGTVLLTERNKAAIKALREQLKEGKKKMALFYGAAHMPDLADRLDLMGFEVIETTWRDAWDVHIRPGEPSAFMRLMGRLQEVQRESAGQN